MFPVRQSGSLQSSVLLLEKLFIVQADLSWLLILYYRGIYILCFFSDSLASDLLEKMFFWMSHRSHAEFTLVGFGFCWSLHFSSFHLSIPIFPVGEACVLRVPEPECCACRLFISSPSLQAVSHLCVPVSTPSHTLTLQTALNIFEISFL